MDNQTENFEPLQRLMKLKRHETPPPGYFNNFSRDVMSEIRAQRTQGRVEVTWLQQLWRSLEARPAFAGGFGAAVCAVIIGGIVMMEKPADTGAGLAVAPDMATSSFMATAAPVAAENVTQPLLLASSNAPAPSLFDLVQPGGALPAGFAPGGN
jgi:hypothetical protein